MWRLTGGSHAEGRIEGGRITEPHMCVRALPTVAARVGIWFENAVTDLVGESVLTHGSNIACVYKAGDRVAVAGQGRPFVEQGQGAQAWPARRSEAV